MIYITQLIFVKENKKDAFLQFEEFVLPLLEKFNGKLIYRLRPKEENYVSGNEEKPYEIHFISFNSEKDFEKFMKDDSRKKYIHLKDESVKSVILVKGERLG